MEEGATVEIHSVPAPLEVQAGPTQFRGTKVNPNGKKGHVRLDTRDEHVVVETLDGLCFEVPEGCTREVEHAGPEDGGYDCLWPRSIHQEQEVAHFVSEMLRNRGFCMLHVPEADSLRGEFIRAARADWEYTLLEAEMEEAFLGGGSSSKVSWLAGGFGAGKANRAEAHGWETLLSGGGRHLGSLARELAANPGLVDFDPWSFGGAVLVRVPLATGERETLMSRLQVASLEQAPDTIGEHISFMQRRKLCLMHFLESSGGTVELHDKTTGVKARVPVTRGRLLVFQHEHMSYSYTPRMGATPADDVVLQAWMLEEPPVLSLERLEGEQLDITSAYYDGLHPPKQVESKHVNIMAAALRFPGQSMDITQAWTVWSSQTDTFTEHPRSRWDLDLYYSPDAAQFGQEGKSGTKHGGFLESEMMSCFDNKFFGIEDDFAALMPPTTRLLLECCYEAFHSEGHNKDTLKGNGDIALTVADLGLEWDPWGGYIDHDQSPFPHRPDLWALATPIHGITSGMQVAWRLGICGPVKLVDTACSASLVGACINHASLRQINPKYDFKEAVSMGHQGMFSPFTFIGLSGAGMLGRGGRCKTFDQTANGYNRGEGVGGLIQRVSDDPEVVDLKLGNYYSSFVNQDGRSASLTAPNGPSQQAVMRNSMKLEELDPTEISIQENHGTGTALGDPIEVGSVRAVYRKRPTPIPVTSGKTHCGHLESTAGSLGIIKSMMSILFMTEPPNVHLYEINAHIDLAGFPGLFPVECIDLAQPQIIGALNGFGFGGTNSHSELWGKARMGHNAIRPKVLRDRRVTGMPLELGGRQDVLANADWVIEMCPRCWGPMCARTGIADPAAASEEGRQLGGAIRQEFASYEFCSDCYTGGYLYGDVAPSVRSQRPVEQAIFIVGSWNGWSKFEEMREDTNGDYVAEVRLGEAGFEQFHLTVGEGKEQAIIPVVCNASPDARIVGPIQAWRSQCWLIDGRADKTPSGTMYEVRFRWEERSKTISWKRLVRRQRSSPHKVSFSIVGSFSSWQPQDMQRSTTDPSLWEFAGQLGKSGEEQLHFLRDGDAAQRLYPLVEAVDDPSVPVVGPGPSDEDKNWKVFGEPESTFIARLKIKDGSIAVEFKTGLMATTTWRSLAETARDTYQLVGSYCGWYLDNAQDFECPDPSRPGYLVSSFYIGELGREEFQITVNRNWSQVLHPDTPSAPGHGFLAGPEPADPALNWEVFGTPGQKIEVIFDHGADDSLRMVTVRHGDLAIDQ
mmetsp:Transcript_130168/g.328595  ORF Transcript_130168/g.328595 Transcript_130168/m.328595 type:complete len:1251 (+) Transcript_130168:176-3928(+)